MVEVGKHCNRNGEGFLRVPEYWILTEGRISELEDRPTETSQTKRKKKRQENRKYQGTVGQL